MVVNPGREPQDRGTPLGGNLLCLGEEPCANIGARERLLHVQPFQLGRAAIVDLPTTLLAAASALTLLRFKPNSAWLVLGGGLVGLALAALR